MSNDFVSSPSTTYLILTTCTIFFCTISLSFSSCAVGMYVVNTPIYSVINKPQSISLC
jgi:hypothetical protein